MKRWRIPLAVMLASCAAILYHHCPAPQLARDTDTRVLLSALDARHSPWSWFTSDWPLQNHFYRPISTLAFEFDRHTSGSDPSGYGWTNAALCAACVALLFWFVRELTDDRWLSGAASALFASWILDNGTWLSTTASWAFWPVLAIGLVRHRWNVRMWLPSLFALSYLCHELAGIQSLFYRMMDWLPGRTASVMTVFGLTALACYARYERLGAPRDPAPDPTPLDPPATKSFTADRVPSRRSWPWAVASVLATLVALGSYEQAVMLPAALLGVAWIMRLRRYRVRWGWQAAFWVALVAYLAMRRMVVPSEPSAYQIQQFRSSWSVLLSILDYVLPCANGVPGFAASLDVGPTVMFISGGFFWSFAANLSALIQLRRCWVPALGGLALSTIVFLPMSWLKPFEHYAFMPMALRTLMVAALARLTWELAVTAVSPPPLQAPGRPSPAPGSLPRP